MLTQIQEPSRTASARPPAVHHRADALRNRAAILQAARTVLRRDPDASVAQIADEAGVGRVTLYGHFPSRRDLIEAAVVDTLERGDRVLGAIDLAGDPTRALSRLVAASWTVFDGARGIRAAARRELTSDRIRELRTLADARMRGLLERGRERGAFRTDLPLGWLLATANAAMDAAAQEIAAGRLDPSEALTCIDATLASAFAPPAAAPADELSPPEAPPGGSSPVADHTA